MRYTQTETVPSFKLKAGFDRSTLFIRLIKKKGIIMEIGINLELSDKILNDTFIKSIKSGLEKIDVSAQIQKSVEQRIVHLFQDGEFDDEIVETIKDNIVDGFLKKLST